MSCIITQNQYTYDETQLHNYMCFIMDVFELVCGLLPDCVDMDNFINWEFIESPPFNNPTKSYKNLIKQKHNVQIGEYGNYIISDIGILRISNTKHKCVRNAMVSSRKTLKNAGFVKESYKAFKRYKHESKQLLHWNCNYPSLDEEFSIDVKKKMWNIVLKKYGFPVD